MLTLDTKITLNEKTIKSRNLCDRFSIDDLTKIGVHIFNGYERDEQSRIAWFRRNEAAMDLAMQVQKEKSFPWPDCSNIAFPIVTIAALQFHARAYPTIINGNEVVKCRVLGPDPNGAKLVRAERISAHMSYQVMEEDESWEEEHDRAFIILPIIGCVFFKTYYSNALGYTTSELVQAQDLVMDYYAKSVETCSRKTHIVRFYRNDLHERGLRGIFRDVSDEGWYTSPPPIIEEAKSGANNRIGMLPPSQSDQDTPYTCLEQHCLLDLDGDGYAEPYIVTIEKSSRCVLRIVTGFDREEDIEKTNGGSIISIQRTQYFTKIPFIPSPDGSIYDLGFGILLGPLNESVNSIVNQLVDAGTMSVAAGGFLGRGAKIRGGVYNFSPLEWKRVDSTGDDLRKNIVPLEVREPSNVLFQLLSLLINYANRIPGTTDTMVGENPGQNTPAENMREMVSQGSKLYNSLFKRVWRGLKGEFRKRYILNGRNMDATIAGGLAKREDYLGDPSEIAPAADPNLVSDSERVQQAVTIKQSAASTPGYSVEAVEKKFLKALRVEDIDQIYPGPDKVPPSKHPRVQVEEMRLAGLKMKMQGEMALAAGELMEERRLNNSKIAKLEAEAVKIINDIGIDKAQVIVSAFDSAIGALKHHNDVLDRRIEMFLQETSNGESSQPTGMGQLASGPDDQSAVPAIGAPEGATQGEMVGG